MKICFMVNIAIACDETAITKQNKILIGRDSNVTLIERKIQIFHNLMLNPRNSSIQNQIHFKQKILSFLSN